MDIAEFVKARLDEDERYAQVLQAFARRQETSPSAAILDTADELMSAQMDAPELFEEAMRWKSATPTDLTRVLREVAAKRALIEHHGLWDDPAAMHPDECVMGDGKWPCFTMATVAAIWSDHPDFDQKWTP